MDASPDIAAVSDDTLIAICTYQEALTIGAMLEQLRAAFPDAKLLVVDDASPDGTANIVRDVQQTDGNVRLLERTDERGLGSAIVAAMRVAVQEQCTYFLNLDADLSHDPAQLPALLAKARKNPELDVVIGSRYVPGGEIVGWPLRRRWMSRIVNRFAVRYLSLPVNDCSGSMRCYRTSTLDKVGLDSLQCTGYALLEELLVRIDRLEGKMSEVPITFTERALGQSKLTLAEAFRSIKFMLRLAWQLRRK